MPANSKRPLRTLFICNRLLNLADGGSRELLAGDHWSYQALAELTPIMEDKDMWDVFYVTRSAAAHAFSVFAKVWALREPDDVNAWLHDASQMLMEHHSSPTVLAK